MRKVDRIWVLCRLNKNQRPARLLLQAERDKDGKYWNYQSQNKASRKKINKIKTQKEEVDLNRLPCMVS